MFGWLKSRLGRGNDVIQRGELRFAPRGGAWMCAFELVEFLIDDPGEAPSPDDLHDIVTDITKLRPDMVDDLRAWGDTQGLVVPPAGVGLRFVVRLDRLAIDQAYGVEWTCEAWGSLFYTFLIRDGAIVEQFGS